MAHVFIPDSIHLEELKSIYRQDGKYLIEASEICFPGIFFVHKNDKVVTLEKVDSELINKLIKYWENSWD